MSNRQAYQEYLQSVHWEHLRQNCLGRSGWKCESCHSTRHLHVHHLNYRNLTDCTVADVMSLCENCHNAWHDQYGSHHVATRLEVLTYLKGIPVYHPRFNGPVHPVQKASTQRQKARRKTDKKIKAIVSQFLKGSRGLADFDELMRRLANLRTSFPG